MKKISLTFIVCCLFLLNGCLSRLHNYPIIEGEYVPEVEKEVEIPLFGDEKVDETIKINHFSIVFTEITKVEYDEAEGINVIEDLSKKEDSRTYYSMEVTCMVDDVEYKLNVSDVRSFANGKELYRMYFDSEFGKGDIWLYIYKNYITVKFNYPSSDIKLIRE